MTVTSHIFLLFRPAARFLFLVLLAMALAAPVLHADEGGEPFVRWIDRAELEALLEDKDLVIIDIRTPREFRGGHIPGAVNVPLDDIERGRADLDRYRDRAVLIYCRTVNRSGLAIPLLQAKGFREIYVLRGGYSEYRRSIR